MAENPNVVNMPQPDAVAAAPVEQVKHTASMYCSEDTLPPEFVSLIGDLEQKLEMPIWMIIQKGGDTSDWGGISEQLCKAFHEMKGDIEDKKPVGLMLHSPGGLAEEAYKIVRLFQRRTDKFKTIVPVYAKSAATIMALGGTEIIMGREAELGPLDVQIFDPENQEYDSALNAVQSLERLNAYALTALDQVMTLLVGRTRKKPEALLPLASEYATSMIRPLVEKIDSINLTKKSRDLKVAEDYAVRLMKAAGYSFHIAKRIAGALVERYSTHGFAIDRTEAKAHERFGGTDSFGLGLKITEPNQEIELLFDKLAPYLEELTVIGTIKEANS